jgi:CBS domain-containing protein
MHEPVVSCAPDTPMSDVAALMAAHGIHGVLVRDEPWSLISDRDLLRAAIGRGGASVTAGHIAGRPALRVEPDDDLVLVGAMIADHDCSHALVVDDGLPVGVISTLDIARAMAGPSTPAGR